MGTAAPESGLQRWRCVRAWSRHIACANPCFLLPRPACLRPGALDLWSCAAWGRHLASPPQGIVSLSLRSPRAPRLCDGHFDLIGGQRRSAVRVILVGRKGRKRTLISASCPPIILQRRPRHFNQVRESDAPRNAAINFDSPSICPPSECGKQWALQFRIERRSQAKWP